MRKLFIVPTAAAMVALAVPAQAAQKHRVVVDRNTDSYAFAVGCAEFGPYDFDNLVSGSQKVKVTEVRSAAGTLLQTVFHISLRETETNSATGASLPLKGTVHEVWDHTAGIRTISGMVWMGHQPGAGTYVHDSGRIVLPLEGGEPLFRSGPKEAFDAGGIDPVVCDALANA